MTEQTAEELEERERSIAARERSLSAWDETLAGREQSVLRREQELDAENRSLTDWEAQLQTFANELQSRAVAHNELEEKHKVFAEAILKIVQSQDPLTNGYVKVVLESGKTAFGASSFYFHFADRTSIMHVDLEHRFAHLLEYHVLVHEHLNERYKQTSFEKLLDAVELMAYPIRQAAILTELSKNLDDFPIEIALGFVTRIVNRISTFSPDGYVRDVEINYPSSAQAQASARGRDKKDPNAESSNLQKKVLDEVIASVERIGSFDIGFLLENLKKNLGIKAPTLESAGLSLGES